jgi:hypothetical protein
MKVRDEILVSRPANGGLDVPLIFELDADEQLAILHYLRGYFPEQIPRELLEAAHDLASRGIPQGITRLVYDELVRRGRETEAALIEPFVPCEVK